jgi:hypothetical protein
VNSSKGTDCSGSARAVAVRKEVLFWLPTQDSWAWVHLTWTEEAIPKWPASELVATWDDVVLAVRDAARD